MLLQKFCGEWLINKTFIKNKLYEKSLFLYSTPAPSNNERAELFTLESAVIFAT